MQRIGILHLADLHCFTKGSAVPIGDVKDKTVSKKFREECTYSDSRECFFSNACNILRNYPIDIIACSGDLGQGGVKGSVKEGANYIARLAARLGVKSAKVIISPGNHDLDRNAPKGKEFKEFSDACSSHGFKFANYTTPGLLPIKGLPIVAINSCLGGTEHAFHGLPKKFRNAAIATLKAAAILKGKGISKNFDGIKYQLEAMDIPAVGKSQIEATWNILKRYQAKCAIILSHHNLLPTPNLEVRPYVNIVDSGPLLFGLIDDGRRVLALHGHTHCNSTLTTFRSDSSKSGLLVNIGISGLHSNSTATVSYIQILIEDKKFLEASVACFNKIGHSFSGTQYYKVRDISLEDNDIQSSLDFDKLKSNESLQFKTVAHRLSRPADEKLAAELIRCSNRRNLSITGTEKPIDDWIISRIG